MNKRVLLEKLLHEIENVKSEGDPETWHGVGDAALVKAIELLCDGQDLEVRSAAEKLVAAWRDLPKWYA